MNIYLANKHVAQIAKLNPAADGYMASLPWVLLHGNGKTRTFPDYASTRDEAQKVYAGCRLSRK